MKKLITLGCSLLLLAACGNEIEKKANEKLVTARNAYEHGNYEEAKKQIDSIKILYPKALKARKAGQELILDVELKRQQQKLDSLSEAMQTCQEAFNIVKDKYILEKDTAYQEIGNYLWPTQTIEKNLHRSYLRFQVSELGALSMTSIYCGSSNIHHTSVKATAADGTYMETPTSRDSYETTDMGEKIEKADYKQEEIKNFVEFIALHKDQNIRIEFIGDRKYTTTMHPTDRQAAIGIYELAQILNDMAAIKKAQDEANLKIGFVSKKKERKEQKEGEEQK